MESRDAIERKLKADLIGSFMPSGNSVNFFGASSYRPIPLGDAIAHVLT